MSVVPAAIPTTSRKSTRSTHPPRWMKNFMSLNVCDSVAYALSKYIFYDALNPKYQSFLVLFSTIIEPTSYAKAIQDPRWITVI